MCSCSESFKKVGHNRETQALHLILSVKTYHRIGLVTSIYLPQLPPPVCLKYWTAITVILIAVPFLLHPTKNHLQFLVNFSSQD